MKKIILLFLLITNASFGQDMIYHDPMADFTIGKQYALFGDDVKLRKAPGKNSKVIHLLKIGSTIEILEKTTETIPYNGIESPYYKVSHKGKEGYILGGLISLEKKATESNDYLFAYKKVEFNYHLLIRKITKEGNVTEQSEVLGNPGVMIDFFDNKGIPNVDAILYVNNMPEACGVMGGEIYFFESDNTLKKAISTESHSDAGAYWFNEKLIFPNDEGGVPNKVVYHKEQGEYGDEETNEVHVSKTSREFSWENGELLPRIEQEN